MELSRWIIMIMINIVFLILGCLLDPMAIMVICLPILFPIVTKLGFDPVWFGIIVTINVEMGMITPPFGLNLFILKATIKEVSMEDIVRGSLPFVLLLMLGLSSSWCSQPWPRGYPAGWDLTCFLLAGAETNVLYKRRIFPGGGMQFRSFIPYL